MAVTADEYELPITFGETQAELARLLGVDPGTVNYELHHSKKTRRRGGWYVVAVKLDD